MKKRLTAYLLVLCGGFLVGRTVTAAPPSLSVSPARVVLEGPFDRQQLLVAPENSERAADITSQAVFRSENPEIATVDGGGVIHPHRDGKTSVVVLWRQRQAKIPVEVKRLQSPPPLDFERDIQPILTRFGCNAGACHGKARGQNGFQLSLLGFDPDFDYNALTKEARGRRIFLPAPEHSLLLLKPTGQMAHGGGIRIKAGSAEYKILRRWIEEGVLRRQPETPELLGIQVTPSARIMAGGETQHLQVTARYADGSTRDVTHLAAFQSNESAIASVNEQGRIKTTGVVGEAAIMARYQGNIAVCTVTVPLPGSVPDEFYRKLPRKNFIDDYVWQKLQRLRITPSAAAPDHKFLRRVFVDIIGRLPTPEEARRFLNDRSPDKRERLVDYLLQQPEYADFWANKWADLLRPNPYRVGLKAVLNYDNWIRESFRRNKPYDQFVRELLTAKGSTFRNGAVTLFRDRRSPDELTTIVSQLFLGIRLECAKCHHHPFEIWGQDHFYRFAAYFAKIGRKGRGLSPPISGSEEIIFTAERGEVKHPLTGEVMSPKPLFGTAPPLSEKGDPREVLAAWITSDENPYFAQVMVNRVWADLMGRGLVEPVDDLRATNPPTNAALLRALADDFRRNGYDVKKLIRRITTSYVYGLSSLPGERNVADTRYYSRHLRQRLRAEVLLDAVTAITGVPEDFAAMPPGSGAKQVWTHRIPSVFLDAFGRPDPNQDPPCERTRDTTVVQALHLMNSEKLAAKITSSQGRAARLAASERTPAEIVEELYLLVYARYPDAEELKLGTEFFRKKGTSRREATEDLLWALLNTPEFVFKD